MIYSPEAHDRWLEKHGSLITVGDLACRVEAKTSRACYPYEHVSFSLHAVPTEEAKETEPYRSVRRDLGDDWSTDLLGSDDSVFWSAWSQLWPEEV